MCGIVGIVSEEPVAPPVVGAMCEAITHRGPDDVGIQVWTDHGVGLGHTRLAIIDLSPAGQNPLGNEDGRVWVVFNGEIYNFRELRRELIARGHRFRSETDTEVIVHGYEEWGDDHVHRLRGMFAYALYDRRPQRGGPSAGGFRLLLVRDRLGIKPLFYSWEGRRLLFASEMKAILAAPGVERRLDRTALFDYLTYGYIPAPKTPYTSIRRLSPGHRLTLADARIGIEEYWDVPLERSSPARNREQAADLVRHAVTDAVRVSLTADVPVGAFLSGGVDSSTVTAVMASRVTNPVHTFSVGFDVTERSETHYARLVAERYRTRHHECTVDVEDGQRLLPLLASQYDEPYADGSAIPSYYISAFARRDVKVVVSGDGGDELFAGYNWYSRWMRRRPFDRMPLALRRALFPWLEMISPRRSRKRRVFADLSVAGLEQYARLLEFFPPEQKRRLIAPRWRSEFRDYDDYWYFRQFWRSDVDPLTRIQYLDLKTYLPDDILTKVDRASMAVSLEVRPPLLDHILVEQVISIPSHLRAPGGERKYLLKSAFEDLIPAVILNRPKRGFSAPLTNWMSAQQGWARERLRTGGDGESLLGAGLDELGEPYDSGTRRWALLVLQQWLSEKAGAARLDPSDEGLAMPAGA